MKKEEIDHLLRTKQFYVAVWKTIDGNRHETAARVVSLVSEVVREAIKAQCYLEVTKIMRTFEKYVDHETSVEALTLLNETTIIDLQPDELELPPSTAANAARSPR